ncbi:MAG: phosphoribosylanthranilate isomerase [Candidatus Omnitrophica bacterium]|nr:phosphoribosylanthranilate isomerase [Candidatus Omnitrophota bacterium]MDD5690158.1 phosphoribosylanthranilate isomerase [Candidatus Omnitrophota bacterium]
MVKVKICGITNLEDALASLFSGADAIGLVFYKKSPRYISPLKARNISRILPKKIIRVGVFVDEDIKTVKRIARFCGLDMLQFHGHEPAAYCRKFKGYKIIKAFPVKEGVDLFKISEYRGCGCLFDTYSKKLPGGTGKKFNWYLLKNLDKIKNPVFISGGLTAANVRKAIKLLKPDWIDVSSALESKPGKKDHKKIKQFIQASRKP